MFLRISVVIILLFGLLSSEAQIPFGFNYQAVIRDNDGQVISNQSVSIRFTVLRINTNNTVYREIHQTESNEFGLVNVVVGEGEVVTGNFNTVDWANAGLKMRVEIDPSGGAFFELFGETDFQSVPFALAAETAVNISSNARLSANQILGGGAQQGQVLRWNGVSWVPSNESDATLTLSPRFSGTGASGSPLDLASQGAAQGQVLKWNGNAWAPADDMGSELTAGTGIQISNNAVSARNTEALWNANQLRGRSIAASAPSNGQFLVFDGIAWTPTTVNVGLTLPYAGTGGNSSDPAIRVTNNQGIGLHGRGNVGVRATNTGSGPGTAALELNNGGIMVSGSNRPSFQVSGTGNIAINSPLSNNNPTAMIQVTQINPNPNVNERAYPFSITYNFQEQRWFILSDPDVSLNYNVFIVTQ